MKNFLFRPLYTRLYRTLSLLVLLLTGLAPVSGIAQKEDKNPPIPKNHEQIAEDLSSRLIRADDHEQATILTHFINAPLRQYGNYYTEALAEVISKLNTIAAKKLARDALARRMKRMSISTIKQYLMEDNRELRLAAVAAVQLKNDKSAAHDLLILSFDPDRDLAAAAQETFKTLFPKLMLLKWFWF